MSSARPAQSLNIEAFRKYQREGAYHWLQADASWRNPDFHPPLVARYDALLEQLPEAGDLLDVGCGDGCLLHRVARQRPGLRLHGLDGQAGAITLATALTAQHGVSAELRHGNAYAMPYADAAFDVVLMADVIEHFEQPARALAEAARVLRPGGRLLLSTPHRQPDFSWDPEHHAHEFDAGELSALLEPHFGAVTLNGRSPMAWLRLWRAHVWCRVTLRALARLGFNPFQRAHDTPGAGYGQIIACCVKQ